MLLISGRSSRLRRAASSVSSAAAASPSASSCWRISFVSSVRNRMRPENLIWSGRFSIVPFMQSDYNLSLIKPLAGFWASKTSEFSETAAEESFKMSFAGKRLALAALVALAVLTFGSRQSVLAQETDDPVKIQIYKRFYDNAKTNPTVAYPAARDYLQKYNKDKDQYTDYIQKWIAVYERDERKRNLPILINEKKFSEAYATGAKILADEPGYLRAQI